MTTRATCSFDGCGRRTVARGLCDPHYKQARYGLSPLSLKEITPRYPPRTTCGFSECDRPVKSVGLCDTHRRQASHGVALRPIRAWNTSEVFWSKVQKSGECWMWTGKQNGHGYGIGRGGGSHRQSWIMANGPIPNGLYVLHHCDTPLCVRPDHLFLGTKGDNNRDCKQKGRNAHGEKNGQAVLTENDVIDIRTLRALGARQSSLAEAFGVARSNIGLIVSRQRWAHAP